MEEIRLGQSLLHGEAELVEKVFLVGAEVGLHLELVLANVLLMGMGWIYLVGLERCHSGVVYGEKEGFLSRRKTGLILSSISEDGVHGWHMDDFDEGFNILLEHKPEERDVRSQWVAFRQVNVG